MDESRPKPFWEKITLRQFLLLITLGSIAAVVLIAWSPVNNTQFKLITLAFLGVAWVGMLFLFWKKRGLVLLFPVVVTVPFFLPGRAIETAVLRRDYVERLGGFEGSTYSWGGESSVGIDCSGLMRRAYRDALLSYGIRRVNGVALRAWAEQWWFDASARALRDGYRGYTVPTKIEGKIREMDYGNLLLGDLAVTHGGAHILAYVGDDKWIQADPGISAVATLDGRTDKNVWFGIQVTIHRWCLLGDG